MGNNKTPALSFAERLRTLMRARGLTSNNSHSGVDVGALAKVAGTSYEMARRYADGISMPRGDRLRTIAAWLNVPVSALAWGESGSSNQSEIDLGTLETCINAVLEAQEKTGVKLTTENVASLAAVLYADAIKGQKSTSSHVQQLVRTIGLISRRSAPEPSS